MIWQYIYLTVKLWVHHICPFCNQDDIIISLPRQAALKNHNKVELAIATVKNASQKCVRGTPHLLTSCYQTGFLSHCHIIYAIVSLNQRNVIKNINLNNGGRGSSVLFTLEDAYFMVHFLYYGLLIKCFYGFGFTSFKIKTLKKTN